MQEITEILKTDNYLLILSIIVLILFIGVIVLLINNVNMSRKYKNFMKKLGNGKDLEEDLSNYIIISHADPYVPSLPAHDLQKEDMGYNNERHIFVYERASQLELLSKVKNTCMFVSPMPKHLLNIYGLKEIKCSDKVGMYKDVLIYRKKQKLDSFDELFINELENSIKEH